MDFPCPACGGQLHWKPGAQAMVCPYCSHEVQAPDGGGPVREYALKDAEASAPRGWGTETHAASCDGCGAQVELDPSAKASECPFCGSSQIHPDERDDVLRPETVLPFAVEKTEAVRQFRGWISGLWFRPSALKQAAQLEKIQGIYIPAWTFDAQADSQWQAESGEYYDVEEEVTTAEGTSTRTVRKTRWRDVNGTHRESYDDWIVQASKGLDQAAIKGLQPFELGELKAYNEAYLSGLHAERYAVGLEGAWTTAQQELDGEERQACRRLVPGDTQRNLQVRTQYSQVHFKHLLLPVWVAAYRYEGKAYRYLVNGHSGKATGDAPYSKWKLAGCALLVVLSAMACMGVFTAGGTVAAVLGR